METMKTVRTLTWGCIFFFSLSQVFAQENNEGVLLKKDVEIQKYTIMERFEPGYVVSTQKRAEMKRKRMANTEYALDVLDTMKISNRKRNQLLRDLKYNPFSNRLNKFIVATKFDDVDVENQ